MERDDEGVVEGLRRMGQERASENWAMIAPELRQNRARIARASITCFSRMIHFVRVCGFDASSFFLLTILRA